jgi:hypothetical protein
VGRRRARRRAGRLRRQDAGALRRPQARRVRPSGDRDPLEVEEIDVTTAIGAQFWLNVRGPLTGQPDALARLQKALKGLQGIEVESGMVE